MADEAVLKIQIEEESGPISRQRETGTQLDRGEQARIERPAQRQTETRTDRAEPTRVERPRVNPEDERLRTDEDYRRMRIDEELHKKALEGLKQAKEFNPREQARMEMLRERHEAENKDSIRLERMRIDPDFRQRAQQEAQKQQGQQIGQALRAGGQGGAAGLTEGAMAGAGPAGLAVAGALLIKQKLEEVVEDFHRRNEATIQGMGRTGSAVMGGDFRGLSRSVADVTGELPIFGREVKALGHAFLDLEHAAEDVGQRLGQYNAQIARENINTELTRMLRDMGRANRFQEETVNLQQSRQYFEDRMARLMDRFMPLYEQALTNILNGLGYLLERVDEGFKASLEFARSLAERLGDMLPGAFGQFFIRLEDLLRRMREETPLGGQDVFLDELIEMSERFGGTAPNPGAPRGQVAPGRPAPVI